MSHTAIFHSESAFMKQQPLKEKVRIVNADLQTYKKPVVFWIGQPEDGYLELGDNLGFENCVMRNKDMSVLVYASALVVYQLETYTFPKCLDLIGFAVNYGIPVFWIDKYVMPRQWIHSFRGIFVGDVPVGYFWKSLISTVL